MALGDIHDINELRDVVRRSADVKTYSPHHTTDWEHAYQRMHSYMERK